MGLDLAGRTGNKSGGNRTLGLITHSVRGRVLRLPRRSRVVWQQPERGPAAAFMLGLMVRGLGGKEGKEAGWLAGS